MTERITPGQIKKANRQQIYNHIYQRVKVSQQEIAYALHLSRPTVAGNLAELEEDGLIYRNGQLDSDQIGRKAVAYSVVPAFRVAIGCEVMRHMTKLVAIDLYGRKLRREVLQINYANDEAFYRRVSEAILSFIEDLSLAREQVLGIGFALQGLASPDGRTLIYAAILGCTGLKIDVFEQWLPYPCAFVHDPQAAALSEMWVSPELTDAVYMSLSRHLGGAIIYDRRILTGKHGHDSTFEHIQARPRGDVCYCGKRGCWDTLCSMKALVGDGSAEDFFSALRRGAREETERWGEFLKNLAHLVEDLHLMHDVDIILGGHIAPYLTEEDIQYLYGEIRRQCPFEEEADFIHISKMPSHNITIGAALPYIQTFLQDIDAGCERA